MGDHISLLDSLLITVFSMVVVFIVLVAISYLIDLLRIATQGRAVPAAPAAPAPVPAASASSAVEESANDEELVAVISAAIAASMGVSNRDIRIRSIVRNNQVQTAWAQLGKTEQLFNKL